MWARDSARRPGGAGPLHWLRSANIWQKGTSLRGWVRRLRGMTTILRKYHSVARCTLLGEMIEDTAHRYYYRPHVGGELTFADKESPAIHLTPCPACPDWPADQQPAAPSARTRDDTDPSSSAWFWLRQPVGCSAPGWQDRWKSGQLMSVVEEPHFAERRFLSVLTQRRNSSWRDYRSC